VTPQSFNGTIFQVWKGNRACHIYVTDAQIFFIRRAAGTDPGAAPEQLLPRHTDNYAILVSDIVDPRIERAGKYMSFGKNDGRWHYTRRGDAKETVVLFESPADAALAVFALGGVLGSRLRNECGIVGVPPPEVAAFSAPDRWRVRERDGELVTDHPPPPEQVEVVKAMQDLTRLLAGQASGNWQKIRCEVRVAAPDGPRPLEILLGQGERPDLRPATDPAIDQAAMRFARTLSSSVRDFPGVIIEMTRTDQARWRNHVKLMDTP
jgi:hypothetical protein